jgi:D-alanyl-D-alanine carboxypeptidase
MRRTLPLLLTTATLAAALTACGLAGPGSGSGSGSGSAAAPGSADASSADVGVKATAGAGATTGTAGAGATTGTAAAGAGDEDGTAVKAGTAALPTFHGSIATGRDAVRARVRYSWRRGCPVGPVELRLLRADHWGLDGRVHRGELIVHRDHARRILGVLKKLFQARYPIQRLRLVDAYRADDDRSMAANNTSGFNCRRVSGSSSWSEHAFGRAIDLNPLRNPYVTRGGRVSPPAGRPYANRSRRAAGMIHAGDGVVRAFAAAGWRWGGYWSGSRDYQHFSSTGR